LGKCGSNNTPQHPNTPFEKQAGGQLSRSRLSSRKKFSLGAYLEAASPAPAGIALPAQAPFEFMAAVTAQALGRAAATRSSQQRGSAGWLQSTTTRVTLSAGGIAPPSASRCLGRPKVVTLFHLYLNILSGGIADGGPLTLFGM
jgi:hypothetical protein